jgi:hypothetical protein
MKLKEKVVCADGFEMSVQAHYGAYCSPREDGAERYTEVEVGYPSHGEPMLLEWAEDPTTPTQSIYGYVPVRTVGLVIAKHGGMVSGEVPVGVPPLQALPKGWED